MLRRGKRKTRTHDLPQTLMGRVVRINTLRLDDQPTFRDFVSRLRSGGEIHSTALIETIFPIAARQMIHGPQQVNDIPPFVQEVRSTMGDRIKPREMELLIRHAIGQEVSIDGIDPQAAGIMRGLTFMRFADILAVTGGDPEGFVNPIIVQAEADLERRGIPQLRVDDR